MCADFNFCKHNFKNETKRYSQASDRRCKFSFKWDHCHRFSFSQATTDSNQTMTWAKRVCGHLSCNFLRNMWIQHVKGQHSTTVQLHKIHPEALGLMINTDIEQLQWLMQPCVWMFYLFVEPQSIMPVLAGVMTEITQITSSSELHSRISECQDSHSLPLAVEWCYWCQRQRSCHGDGRHGGISRGRLMAKWSRASMTAKNQTGQVAEINMEESPKGRQERDRNDKKTGIRGWWWDVYRRFVK